MTPASFRWRKSGDINREYGIFELLANETPILDVGFSDAGIFEITFNPKIAGVLIEWKQLNELIEEGKVLAEKDR